MSRPGWARAVPPFVVGAALALAAVLAVGLLLYGGPGMLRALSVILATLLGALAAGFATARARRGTDPVESLRRRWLLLLVSFTLAALFAAGWESLRGFGARALSQGIGLALLGALPLFAGGLVLGTLARLSRHGGDRHAPGTAAMVGGAAGALLLGFLLFPAFSSAGILLASLVALSGAALVQGWELDRVTFVRPEEGPASEEAPPAERHLRGALPRIRVERWVRDEPPVARTAVVEEDRLRLVVEESGAPVLAPDRFVVGEVPGWLPTPGRALILGAGGALLARRLWERWGERGGRVRLLEGDPSLARAAMRALHLPEGDEAFQVQEVAVAEALAGSPGFLPPSAFDLVYLDTLSLAWRPGHVRLPPGGVARIRQALRPQGILVAGPFQDGGHGDSLLARARGMSALFAFVSAYVGPRVEELRPDGVPDERHEAWRRVHPDPGSRPGILVAGAGEPSSLPDRVEGFLWVRLEDGGRPAARTDHGADT